jgi:hypothetical protein
LNVWYCFDGVEQVQFLCWILDVHVDEEEERFADVLDCNLEAVEALGFGCCYFGVKFLLRFLLTMPSEAATNATTWEMKWHSVLDSPFQSARSAKRSISSAIQKEPSAFFVKYPHTQAGYLSISKSPNPLPGYCDLAFPITNSRNFSINLTTMILPSLTETTKAAHKQGSTPSPTNNPMELEFDLAAEPAVKATIPMVTCTSVAYGAICVQNLFGFASTIIIGVIGVIMGTYKTPPLCAIKTI